MSATGIVSPSPACATTQAQGPDASGQAPSPPILPVAGLAGVAHPMLFDVPRDCHPATLTMRQRHLRELERDDRRQRAQALGLSTDEVALEWFPTPPEVTQALLPHLGVKPGAVARILEPCGGRGDILDQLVAAGWQPGDLETVEYNAGHAALLTAAGYVTTRADYLLWAEQQSRAYWHYDLIIGNPPFSLFAEFALASLSLLAKGGTLALLGRHAHVEGEGRVEALWRRHGNVTPHYVYWRPQFVNNGCQPREGCTWFVWREGQPGGQPVWLERPDVH